MPWKWIPPAKNEDLLIYPTPLERLSYHCPYCDGWIEGSPIREEENTIGPLCGRSGVVLYCRRCGEEIGFFGEMS